MSTYTFSDVMDILSDAAYSDNMEEADEHLADSYQDETLAEFATLWDDRS